MNENKIKDKKCEKKAYHIYVLIIKSVTDLIGSKINLIFRKKLNLIKS